MKIKCGVNNEIELTLAISTKMEWGPISPHSFDWISGKLRD